MAPTIFHIDIEPTNRCNADCYFCPRDQTPHQGLMSEATFGQALERTIEFDATVRAAWPDEVEVRVHLCGLGEPLLNKHTPAFVRRTTEAGYWCSVTSNGALLDERRGDALLEAGMRSIEINVGELDEDYEKIYGLPFERTRANVERFIRDAGDDCRVQIVVVDHRGDPDHVRDIMAFWREAGARHFLPFALMNRGGSLDFEGFDYSEGNELVRARELTSTHADPPACGAPFTGQFIGYDGNYYLCCSDWRKEVVLGNVVDDAIAPLAMDKLARVVEREPICATCNLDPLNQIMDTIRARDRGATDDDPAELAGRIEAASASIHDIARRLTDAGGAARPARTRIPVRATTTT